MMVQIPIKMQLRCVYWYAYNCIEKLMPCNCNFFYCQKTKTCKLKLKLFPRPEMHTHRYGDKFLWAGTGAFNCECECLHGRPHRVAATTRRIAYALLFDPSQRLKRDCYNFKTARKFSISWLLHPNAPNAYGNWKIERVESWDTAETYCQFESWDVNSRIDRRTKLIVNLRVEKLIRESTDGRNLLSIWELKR